MTNRSISTIDPGGVARQRGADGEGIVIAIVGGGTDGRHWHFVHHDNLRLPPPLHHYDLTLVRDLHADSDEAFLAQLQEVDGDLHNREALIARSGHSTHAAAIVAGYAEAGEVGQDWELDERAMSGVAPKCKLLNLKVLDDEGRGDESDVLRALELVIAL